MRCLLGLLWVFALAVGPLLGCSENGGGAGSGGDGGGVACEQNVCACSEAGILAAIEAAGDDPYAFDCDGPQTVATQAAIVIDNDVILDGEGNLTVRGDHNGRVFVVQQSAKAELHRLDVTHGPSWTGGGIANEGTLTVRDCLISKNLSERGIGAFSDGGSGIFNAGEMTIINSTVSENSAGGLGDVSGGGILNAGWMSLTNSTISGNRADSGTAISIAAYPSACSDEHTELSNTLIDGDCDLTEDGPSATWVSNGHNIESPGDTCGLHADDDQADISEQQLNLESLPTTAARPRRIC